MIHSSTRLSSSSGPVIFSRPASPRSRSLGSPLTSSVGQLRTGSHPCARPITSAQSFHPARLNVHNFHPIGTPGSINRKSPYVRQEHESPFSSTPGMEHLIVPQKRTCLVSHHQTFSGGRSSSCFHSSPPVDPCSRG